MLVPEDIAVISSKSGFNRCRDFLVIKATDLEYVGIGEPGCSRDVCGKEDITPQP